MTMQKDNDDTASVRLKCMHCGYATRFSLRDIPSPSRVPAADGFSYNTVRCAGCGGQWLVRWDSEESRGIQITAPSALFYPSRFGLVDAVPKKHNDREDLFLVPPPKPETDEDHGD